MQSLTYLARKQFSAGIFWMFELFLIHSQPLTYSSPFLNGISFLPNNLMAPSYQWTIVTNDLMFLVRLEKCLIVL